MSETVTESVVTETPASAPATEVVAPESTIAAETPEGPTTTDPDPAPKPDKVERRIANLTRKLADEARARQAVEARAAAAEALLQAKEAPESQPAASAPDVETRAAQIVQEREFNRRLSEIDATGKKNLGADAWEQAKATMTGLGATNHTPFLQALAETENPDKIFVHFADDTDALMELLAKPPAALAAKLGRLDAELGKPAARPLSSAPTPPPKPARAAVVPEADPLNYPATMSMREWNKMMDAHLPPSLGGKKKVA